MQRSISWRFEGRLMVVVQGAEDPSNLEWQRMLTDEAGRALPSQSRTLIVSYGGKPDGRQRELLGKQIARRPAPTCIMTKSALVRAIATALLFFNRNMKVFGLEERDRAYEFLGFSAQERDTANRLRKELEAELGLTNLHADGL
ncbi:MAG TPA: hypothetical protein VJV79_25380 [Polyangiaceae bacterium]|nr:hypothetical protein [Polyangiaceae bacterium]